MQIAGACDGPYSSGKIAQMQTQGQLPTQTVSAPEGSTPTTNRPDPGLFATKCQDWRSGWADIDRRYQEWILNPC